MKQWQRNAIAVLGWSALAVGLIGFCFLIYSADHPEACLPDVPRVLIDGRMYTPTWDIYYELGDAGKLESSGESCTAWRRVTEAEYERRVYGSE